MKKVGTYTLTREFQVQNKWGLHAKPAALFVKTASLYKAEITVTKGSTTVSGKSVLGLLSLGAAPGSKLIVRATGVDAREALEALEKLIKSKFEEE
jgi:phosphocarrier protein